VFAMRDFDRSHDHDSIAGERLLGRYDQADF
jgi:hypothetical protein